MNQPQITRQEAFMQASTYANFAHQQPLYMNRAIGTPLSAYDWAVADYFGKPQVLDLDASEWTGGTGQTIRIRAKDNVRVLAVRVVIRDGGQDGTVLEEGEAEQSETDSLLWTFTTCRSVTHKPGSRLDVLAFDLPGNVGGYSLELM